MTKGHFKPKKKGTQIAWDDYYYLGRAMTGLHTFNIGDEVYRNSRTGRVKDRTALTATIVWERPTEVEVVDQFDETVFVAQHILSNYRRHE